ncbi:MAG: hypothetical protein EOO90_10250 [Pedobacter sp.]|nr:MAG: hypothetical protein EOO90_10250 [Pedobacter sp.]
MNRILKFTLAISLFLSYQTMAAQERAVTLEVETQSNKNVDFNFRKTDPGNYTVAISFTNLTNSSSRGTLFNANGYNGRLLSLVPTNKEQGIGYSYSYTWIRGKLKPKYDANFIYLLPYKDEVKVEAIDSKFLGATYFGDTTPEDWKALRFYTSEQDTVTAIRKGIVVDIKDLYQSVDDSGVSYTSKTNELTIEHEDGTIATYRGFKKGSFTVKLGETVFPSTSLGLNSRYDANGKFNISVIITYLKSSDFANRSTVTRSKSMYGFINPHFMTADSADELLVSQKIYMAASSPEIIKKEMTKKELKLYTAPKK